MGSNISILFLGDVIGQPGRRVICEYLSREKDKYSLIIANIENIAHGFGVLQRHVDELKEAGVQVFTGGNHTFDRKDIFDFINDNEYLLRPANYPKGTPGRGHCLIDVDGVKVGIINVQGRVFMEPLMSPFVVADELVEELSKQTKIIFVDLHAEATAEKVAMGWYLDGRASVVVGTHTHVATADARILTKGTAYQTDAGCCGPINGVIGMEQAGVFRRLVQQLPSRLEVADGPAAVCGIAVQIDKESGRAKSIERVHFSEAQ